MFDEGDKIRNKETGEESFITWVVEGKDVDLIFYQKDYKEWFTNMEENFYEKVEV